MGDARTRFARVALATALLVAPLALEGTLSEHNLVDGLLLRHAGGAVSAPPTLLLEPADGSGAHDTLALRGTAHDDDAVLDVEVRLDDGPWRSAGTVTKGLPVASWTHTFAGLPPGIHVGAARASDAHGYSLPASFTFKVGASRAPPSVALLEPRDGAGLAGAEEVVVAGSASGDAPIARVAVSVDGAHVGNATLTSEGVTATLWRFTVPAGALAPGIHRIEATAFDDAGGTDGVSLPRASEVAVADGGRAPAVRLLEPVTGAGVSSETGTPGCVVHTPCVAVRGTLDDPSSLASDLVVSVDGAAWRSLSDDPSFRLDRAGTAASWSFEWPLAGAYAGKHVIRVRAEAGDGTSVPASTAVNVASDRSLRAVVAPRTATTGVPIAVTATWPDGTNAVNASWTLDGERADGDGVGVLHLNFTRPRIHDVEVIAFDATGRSARASAVVVALNRPPVALLAPVEAGRTNTTVVLDATPSVDPDGHVTAYRWALGDGTSTGWVSNARLEHAYGLPGRYVVTLTVRDDLGLESADHALEIPVANAPPVARILAHPSNGITVRTPVTLSDASVDPDGPVVARSWDLGRGATSTNKSVTHTFTERGHHRVELTVWDGLGETASVERLVHVANLAPEPDFDWFPEHPRAGELVRFRDRTTDADGPVTLWEWTFDGENGSRTRSPAFTFATPGNYTVVLRATDDYGETAAIARTLRVGNSPPFVEASAEPISPRSLEEVRFRGHAADLDGEVVRLEWHFGDGVRSNRSDPVHAFASRGTYNVTLTAWDDLGARSVHDFTLVVRNLPPEVEIVSVLDDVYAGVPVRLEGRAHDRDGVMEGARWEIEGPTGVESLDGRFVTHEFREPGVHSVTFLARDDAGDWGRTTRDVQVDPAPTWRYPPVVNVEFPRENGTFLGLVRFTGTAASPAPLSRVEVSFWRDGRVVTPFATPWVAAEGRERWGFDFDSHVLANGPLLVVVRAVDARGAIAEALVPVVIANVDQAHVQRIVLDVHSLHAGASASGTHVLRGTAFHPDGITNVRARVDDGPWADVLGQGASWAYPIDTTRLKNGAHTVTVRAYHGPYAHRDAVVPFDVANHPPIVTVTRPMPPNATGVVTVAGGLDATRPPGEVFWRVDRGPWRAAEGNPDWVVRVDSRDVPNGEHVLDVMALSSDGLQSPVVSFRFVVRNVAYEEPLTPRSHENSEHATPFPEALAPLTVLAVAFAFRRRRTP